MKVRDEVIEFLCPKGHRIHCPDEQAGRAAKCPRCGVKFRIPYPSEVEDVTSGGDDSTVSEASLTDSDTIEPASSTQEMGEPQIEFLCPNGHRLHGPAGLQGRPGECPDCGSRFRIPTYNDVSDDEEMELDISLGGVDGGRQSSPTLPQVGRPQNLDQPPPSGRDLQAGSPAMGAGGAPGRLASPHPLAALFAELWDKKPQGAAVEVHFGNGETIVPDRFAKGLSQQSHAVFAVKEPGGNHTLHVVAWESIVHVLVQGVEQLPPEMSG